MLKRAFCLLLALLCAAAVPVFLAGCEKDEIRVERRTEIKNMPVGQQTVVE